MTLDLILAFMAYAFVTAATPGPNNTMLLASGANFGLRRTLPHMLGISIGFAVMLLAVGLGFGALFKAFPVLHTVLRYVGGAWMIYLAWRIATSGGPGAARGDMRPLTLLEAAAFQWVNPKAWVINIGAVATYIPQENFLFNLVVCTALYTLVAGPGFSVWVLAGTALRGFLSDPTRLRVFNIAMALLLVASLYPLFMHG